MRAKIMLLLLLLYFAPLLLVVVDTIADFDESMQRGSRSIDVVGNVSVVERHIRFIDRSISDSLLKEKSTARRKQVDKSIARIERSKGEELWLKSEIDDDFLKMHAFVVRDEHIPKCDMPADKVTVSFGEWLETTPLWESRHEFTWEFNSVPRTMKSRYFMCSGVILDENHVLTSATCVNQAHIYEYHIDADLGVLIGALEENSYVIKIAHYEIHPRYVPDPNSIHHATNNIALLRLSCSIRREYIVVPRLPSKRFQDVAHLCCANRCKLSTVIENTEKQHVIRLMRLKHLPLPMHMGDRNSSASNRKRYIMDSNWSLNDQVEQGDFRKLTSKILRRIVRQLISSDTQAIKIESASKISTDSVVKNFPVKNKTRINIKKSVNHSLHDDDGAIDWERVKMEIYAAKVSDKNQKILSNFVQNSTSDIMTKLLEVLAQHIADINNVYSYFENILQEEVLHETNLTQKISDLVGRSVLKFALRKMSLTSDSKLKGYVQNCNVPDDIKVEKKLDIKRPETVIATSDESHARPTTGVIKDDETRESDEGKNDMRFNKGGREYKTVDKEKDGIVTANVFCPPLGSPVITNDNTLVALIAYTCDDVQNWVEWKYVNIIHNIRWIRKELSRNLTKILTSSIL